MQSFQIDATPPAGESAPAPPARRRSARAPLGLGAAAIGVVAVVLALTAGGGAGPVPSAAAAETVQRAAATTLHSPDVRISMRLGVSTDGLDTHLTGTGACDTRDFECAMAIDDTERLPSGGTVGTIREEMLPDAIYLKWPSSIASELPEPWMSIPFSTSKLVEDAHQSFGGDPLSQLAQLARLGASVAKVGPARVDGIATTEYQVRASAAVLRREVASLHGSLPSWLSARIASVSTVALNEHVYVGGGRLVEVTVTEDETVHGTTVATSITETLTPFRGTVHVTAPPAGDVMSLQQFEASLAGASGSI